MVIRCMEKLLTEEQYEDLYNSIKDEIKNVEDNIHSISIDKVLNIMGFPVNNEQENEYNNDERYLENFRSSKSFRKSLEILMILSFFVFQQ